jgi:uncharacterized protein YbaA (DUF1428 family)
MSIEDTLYDLEKGFWTGGAEYYRRHLDAHCLTVFAEMAALMSAEQIAQSVGDHRWHDLEMTRKGCLNPAADFAIISYEAKAGKADRSYRANVSSGYVRRGDGWRMAFHQQTPLTT